MPAKGIIHQMLRAPPSRCGADSAARAGCAIKNKKSVRKRVLNLDKNFFICTLKSLIKTMLSPLQKGGVEYS
jgi:hypothetical protein